MSCGRVECDALKKKIVVGDESEEWQTRNDDDDMSKDKMQAMGIGCCNQ